MDWGTGGVSLTLAGWLSTEPEGDPSVMQVIPSELLLPSGSPGLPPEAAPVNSIGAGAFGSCIDLPSVVIPATVTNIGDKAFVDCASLWGVYFLGNAPICSPSAFSSSLGWTGFDENAVAYYLPGTTGWSNSFAGIPTAPCRPKVQTTGFSFGTNQFGFTVTGLSDLSVAVDASVSLVNPAWVPLATNTLTGGSAYFSDPQWTNYPARFYRVRMP